jgi:outer membrane protein assembly factor BamB
MSIMAPKSPAANTTNAPAPHPAIRWWPAILILIGSTATLLWIWLVHDTYRQERVLFTAITLSITTALTLTWLLAFARLPRPFRLRLLAIVVLILLIGPLLLNIRGVTGDLLPILEWRWKSAAAEPPADRSQPAHPHHSFPPATKTTNDYPQFLGPDRDTRVDGPRLARNWAAAPPELVWRQPIQPAWSAFSISGHTAVTQEQDADQELVVAYNLHSGERLWSHADQARYATTIAGEGPRATPTIAGDRVYTLGATGILNCLDLETGQRIWSTNIIEQTNARVPEWGLAGSPLLHGTLVIVSAGGTNGRSLLAYDRSTGRLVWSGGSQPAGYSSPMLAELAGVTQILIFNAPGLAAHDPEDGRTLWEFPWAPQHPHVAMPLLAPPHRVLISSGYGTGSAFLQLSSTLPGTWDVQEIWRSIRMKAKFSNLTRIGDFVYGIDDGIMACLDLTDGSQRWKDGRYGHGQQILVENLLLILTERGAVALVEPNPVNLRELGRFQALKGKSWNPPALAGNLLLVRNDQEAACYRLPLAADAPEPGSDKDTVANRL